MGNIFCCSKKVGEVDLIDKRKYPDSPIKYSISLDVNTQDSNKYNENDKYNYKNIKSDNYFEGLNLKSIESSKLQKHNSLDNLVSLKLQFKRELCNSSQNLVWEGSSKRQVLPQEHYMKVAAIGIGAYGKVFEVKNIHTDQVRALKVIKKSIESKLTMTQISEELKILKGLDHPNIIQVYEAFEAEDHFYIVSELCSGGDLLTQINSMEQVREYQAKYILKQLLSAISYVHTKNIIHGDVKLENIMIDDIIENKDNSQTNYEIKLIDFGCSRLFIANQSKRVQDIIGTTYYLSPELIKGQYDEKCDIWSCGIILYVLLAGDFPFKGKKEKEIFNNIKMGKLDFSGNKFDDISENCKNLLKKLLNTNSNERPRALEALHDEWFHHEVICHDNPVIVKSNTKKLMRTLKSHKKELSFQHIVKAYITHNFTDKEKIKDLRDIFKFIDIDDDGKISKEDLTDYYKSEDETQTTINNRDIDSLMYTIDFDGNGFIEYEEFIEATIEIEDLINDVHIEEIFSYIDAEHTDYIFAEEIVNYFTIGKIVSESQRKEYIEQLGFAIDEEIILKDFILFIRKLVLES